MAPLTKFAVKILRMKQSCDLDTKVSGLKSTQVQFLETSLLVSSHGYKFKS